MTHDDRVTFCTPLARYEGDAERLFADFRAGDDAAAWRFKWQHSRFRGKGVEDVRAAADTLMLADAREVVARDDGFETWDDLVAFTQAVAEDGPVARFETAVEAVVDGDVATLRRMLAADPAVARARSTRRHHATLLHYVAANGVEDVRQRTPANVLEVSRLLLDAGAEPNALAGMYDDQCTTLGMLVSSSHPAEAGVQLALAELLIDRGASFEAPGSRWNAAIDTALAFGYLETAQGLARRGAPVRTVAQAAGLGDLAGIERLLPSSTPGERQRALALAAQMGHADVVRLLLAAGADPDRYQPEGLHSHATPLHHAALHGHLGAVRALVEHGARLDRPDALYRSTPLGWAEHGGQAAVMEYLRARLA